MQPSTLTRREYKGKIYVKNINGGSETGSGSGTNWKVESGSGSEKKTIQDPQTAYKVKEENGGLYFLRV